MFRWALLRPADPTTARFVLRLRNALVALLVLFAAPAGQLETARAQETGPSPAKDTVKDRAKEIAKAPAKQSAEEPKKALPKAEPREPIERRPYRISFHLACDPSARIDAARRAELLQQWHVLVKRFVGPPWIVTIEPATGPLQSADVVAELPPEAFAGFTSFDKVWVVRASRSESGPGLVFVGREYDTASRRLGALQRRQVSASCDAPRALFEFALDLFNPTAEITGQEGGGALLKVQGGGDHAGEPVRCSRHQREGLHPTTTGLAQGRQGANPANSVHLSSGRIGRRAGRAMRDHQSDARPAVETNDAAE